MEQPGHRKRSFLGRGLLPPPGTFPWSGTQYYHWGAFSVHEHFQKSDIKDMGSLVSAISHYHCFLGTTLDSCLAGRTAMPLSGMMLSSMWKAGVHASLSLSKHPLKDHWFLIKSWTLWLNYTFQDSFVTHIHGPKSLQMTGLWVTLEVIFFLIIRVNVV